MFKKKCPKCNDKINSKFNFCPNCGNKMISNKDWGMIGRNDVQEQSEPPMMGGFGGGMLNKMIGSAMKMIEREMKEIDKSQDRNPRSNFKLMVNGKEVKFNPPQEKPKEEKREVRTNDLNSEQLGKFSKLPRKEPETTLKRLGDKIVYELNMPEVKSTKDVFITRLETSMEIRAIGKKNSYFKIIPINFPIINQEISNGKLILELEPRNQ
jgi:hypothetical protein